MATDGPLPGGYDEESLDWFERFSVEPADPQAIQRRLAEGQVLETLDVPSHLDRDLSVEPGTGLVLYRLVQLFGTPNVPGRVAGGDQADRNVTTWQYLFDVTFESEGEEDQEPGDEEDPERFLLSIYDYRTGVSVGLSAWRERESKRPRNVDGVSELGVRPPTGTPVDCPGVDPPDEEFLEGLLQLALNVVEEPVPATYKELWV